MIDRSIQVLVARRAGFDVAEYRACLRESAQRDAAVMSQKSGAAHSHNPLHYYDNRETPTYENQLRMARELLEEKGRDALYNPHAATGKICNCGDCFCCAALQVWKETR